MRVSYLARSRVPSRSANSIHVMRACEGYGEAGHRATLTVPRWRPADLGDVGDVTGFYGVAPVFGLHRLWSRTDDRTGAARMTLAVLAELARQRPHLVHTRSIPMAWTAAVLVRRPTVLELHMEPARNTTIQRQLRSLQSSGRLRLVVAVSQPLADVLADQLLPATPIMTEPDAVQASWLTSNAEVVARTRSNGPGLCITYAGHLYEGRGVPLILEMARQRPQHRFRIVGGRDPDIERVARMAIGIPNVEMVGFVPPAAVAGELRSADVLLMPYERVVRTSGGADSSTYASPLKMFEYMASGRVILASDVPMVASVLRHEVNALLAEVGDLEGWLSVLDRVEAAPSLRDRLAARALRDVETHTWRARAERILDAACPDAVGG